MFQVKNCIVKKGKKCCLEIICDVVRLVYVENKKRNIGTYSPNN